MRAVLGTVPDPNRDWVTFDASTTQLLRRYLDPSGIDELREACDFIGGLHHAQLSNPPSNTATRRSLKRIADVSDKLAACLDTSCSDFETLAATLEIGAGDGTGLHKTNELRKLLSVLALGCRKRAASLPRQVRRRTPEVHALPNLTSRSWRLIRAKVDQWAHESRRLEGPIRHMLAESFDHGAPLA